jgi:hypothetical protein
MAIEISQEQPTKTALGKYHLPEFVTSTLKSGRDEDWTNNDTNPI